MNNQKLQKTREKIETYLEKYLDYHSPHANILFDAMRYSVLGGGKRLRGMLVIYVAEMFSGKETNIYPVACALEMIHAYSLVHDDLPAMDDDDYRRGKLSTHKKYSEAIGILTGDALLTHAFSVIASKTEDKQLVCSLVEVVAKLAGIEGMVIGQTADIVSENQPISNELLDFIHINKTGALIAASCECGAIASHTSDKDRQTIKIFGEKIGLAFQIVDDLLDALGTKDKVGKAVGKDAEKGKMTYPKVWGVDKSKEMANQLIDEAHTLIKDFSNNEMLLSLANYVTKRQS